MKLSSYLRSYVGAPYSLSTPAIRFAYNPISLPNQRHGPELEALNYGENPNDSKRVSSGSHAYHAEC